MTIPSRFGAKLSGSLSDGMNSGVNLFAVGEVGAGAGADPSEAPFQVIPFRVGSWPYPQTLD